MEQTPAAPRFVVSARKYRPATFRTVVGQGHVTQTLQNAIGAGKLAQAFLFCGPRGVGKTTCARILAKTINCTARTPEFEACDDCDSCRAFREHASFNVHELDAASNNSVDDIRSLVEQVRYPPQAGRYKVYIIDEVHMLSNAAFNAFLKTLEEPPSYAIFILATTERHKIIPTILSRCQTFDFNRIRPDDIARHLTYIAGEEGLTAEPEGLHLIAQKADGGLRDALSIFDQIVTFSGGHVTYQAVRDNLHVLDYDTYFRLTDALLAEHHAQALLLFDEVLRQGFDGHLFVVGWAGHLRDLLVSQSPETLSLLEVADTVKARYAKQAQAAPATWLLSALTLAGTADRDYKQARNSRLHVELLLLKAAHLRGALRFATLEPGHNGHAAPALNGNGAPTNGAEKKKPDAVPVDVTLSAEVRPAYGTNGTPPAAPPPAAPVSVSLPPPAAPPDEPELERVVARPAAPVTTGRRVLGLATAAAPALVDAPPVDPTTTFGQQPVSAEAFQAAWRALTEQKQRDNRINDFTLLNRELSFDPATLEARLPLDSALQVSQFNSLRADLLASLRGTLRNGKLTVTPEVVQQQQVRRPYTDSEKLDFLKRKHPVLTELTERLGLEANF